MTDVSHKLLPAEAQYQLRWAAQTEYSTLDPRARILAINEAAERVRRTFPSYFRQEQQNETEA